ncbi:MAG: Ppx/GppA phosphatase family protein [Thermodesulfobacteriota bacterium]|nr:Ppx/GppA phosphatase family protein [Thermodesulfobacteriota bacterium]
MTRFASVDIGTNTIRLLIADLDKNGELKRVLHRMEITRLGENLVKGGEILPGAIERSIGVLKGYSNLTKKYKTKETFAVATSVFREANNRDEFLKRVYKSTGLKIKIISGIEEARICFLGIVSAMGCLIDNILVIDVGGGSTELLIANGKNPITAYSLHLGAVYLTERFIQSDPPMRSELDDMRYFIDKSISSITRYMPETWIGSSSFHLVGTAGTITTLAALDQEMRTYNPDRINGYLLTRESIQRIYNMLIRLPLKKRRILNGLGKKRADIIIAGMVIVMGIMDSFMFDELKVSDAGLLEGIIVDAFEKSEEGCYEIRLYP